MATSLFWQAPDWIPQVHAWIYDNARRLSIQITGEIQPAHLFPWSTVLVVPTAEGSLYFKATGPETMYEAALTQVLAKWDPDCMPELLAVEPVQGWMLMCNGGQQLRDVIRSTQDIRPWQPILTRYAELQIGLVDRISELKALGLPEQCPVMLSSLFPRLLADESSMLIGQPKGLTPAEFQQLQNLSRWFEQVCLELTRLGIPNSIDHGDFHDANVLVKDERFTFSDWGDAAITHPFLSLRTLFFSVRLSLNLQGYSFTPEMEAVLDRYLSNWQPYATKETLRKAFRLSLPVAAAAKALAWQETFSLLEEPERREYAWLIPELMREFLAYEKMLSD